MPERLPPAALADCQAHGSQRAATSAVQPINADVSRTRDGPLLSSACLTACGELAALVKRLVGEEMSPVNPHKSY